VIIFLSSCQKKLKINYDSLPIKQVIIGNMSPNHILKVNISKSKTPDDFNPVEFLSDCKVDIYENGTFRETMPFNLKDTLSGLGYYTTTFSLSAGKTYRIVSVHPQLGTAEATEYLPPFPGVENITLFQHAGPSQSGITGKYSITFKDSAQEKNYYYISTYYRILKPVIDEQGDTTYVYDFIFIPSHSPEISNPSDYNRLFFTDDNFDGQRKNFIIDFPSQYNDVYRSIDVVIELSNSGKNFYNWNVQQIPVGQDFLNEGQEEKSNIKSNIINGYGHFTGTSTVVTYIPIK
jgi:hypothetical protein